MLKEDLQ